MKYIICGIEHIGLKVVKMLLQYKEDVTLITLDSDEHLLQEIKDKVNLYIEGNAKHKRVLEMSGIYNADVLMILTSNDANNIEIQLTAREMNKDIKIITSLHNKEEGLCKEIEEGFAITKAINIPSFSAPSFVSACLGDSVLHVFNHDGITKFIGQKLLEENSVLAGKTICEIENAYNIKVIRLIKENKACACLLKDSVLMPGDRMVFLTPEKKFISLVDNNVSHEKSDIGTGKNVILKGGIEKITRHIPSNIKFIMLLYGLLILLSTLFYFCNMEVSLIDAFYFVITTTTTVGFGDINLLNEKPLVKLYGTFMMISGAALLAAFFSILADSFIRKRFEQIFGSSKFKLKNHVIIAGMGGIGYRVANMLHENGVKVVVIEKDSENRYIQLLRGKIPIIYGDAQFGSILSKAGIEKAQTMAALINEDIKNLNIVLQAKKLNKSVHTVTRIFNPKIEAVIGSSFDIGNVYSTSMFTMPLFLGAAIQKNTITAFQMEGDIFLLFEAHVNSMPKLKILSENELSQNYGIIIVDKTDKERYFDSGNFEEGHSHNEVVTVFGSYTGVKKLMDL